VDIFRILALRDGILSGVKNIIAKLHPSSLCLYND
jgi:hypothetical protein